MKTKLISCKLPPGVNVSIWQNDDETEFKGAIIPIALQLEIPLHEEAATVLKLLGLVKEAAQTSIRPVAPGDGDLTGSRIQGGGLPDLTHLRALGWSVAVHNDYKINGLHMTFWLFTHPNGRWVKGEGSSDEDALMECLRNALEESSTG